MKKTIVIKLEDNKEITIPYTKIDNVWVNTMSDECMNDICTIVNNYVDKPVYPVQTMWITTV